MRYQSTLRVTYMTVTSASSSPMVPESSTKSSICKSTNIQPWTIVSTAVTQVGLTRSVGLTAWKGGGFGMFSTIDDAPHRALRVVVEAPERSEEIDVAPSIEDDAIRAMTLPSDHRLKRLAEAVAARERRYARPVTRVRITVWRHEVTRDTLGFTPVVLREYTHDIRP